MSSPTIEFSETQSKTAAIAAASQPPETVIGVSSAAPLAPAEDIRDGMVPQSNSPPAPKATDPIALNKRGRSDTVGSLSSMDLFLLTEDLEMDGGRIQSSDFVRDLLRAGPPSLARPAARVERLSSADWVRDFADESAHAGPMQPSLFASCGVSDLPGETPSEEPVAHPLPMPPPCAIGAEAADMLEFFLGGTAPADQPHPACSSPAAGAPGGKKKRRRKPRAIDESRVMEPTARDVLFGRGGGINKHPGNVKFRRKALELRPWYERSSKEEKQRIADILVEFVRAEGGRFLERGKEDGVWHEVIGNGAHTKASQALRERIPGGRRKARKEG